MLMSTEKYLLSITNSNNSSFWIFHYEKIWYLICVSKNKIFVIFQKKIIWEISKGAHRISRGAKHPIAPPGYGPASDAAAITVVWLKLLFCWQYEDRMIFLFQILTNVF